MQVATEIYSFADTDGRVILRASVDRLLKTEPITIDFVDKYYEAVLSFLSERLYLKARDLYRACKSNCIRYFPLSYSFTFKITCAQESLLSCVAVAILTQMNKVISGGIDSFVLLESNIIPPNQLYKAHRNRNIALDSDGFPCIAFLSESGLNIKRVGKKSGFEKTTPHQ